MPASRQYTAFVSYSHADRVVGARLFRELDRYVLPKRLVGAEGRFGPVPKKLYPCFRDREELAAARDVKTELDEVVAASQNLVVLCSPSAAKSEWVAHEIRHFAAINGTERIHAVVVGGDPKDAFPPALEEVGVSSPLAADVRKTADGWSNGRLKLIAGILGVPFGELKDREIERFRAKRRAIFAVTSAFVFTVLGGCGAAWAALSTNERMQQAFVGVIQQISGRMDHVFDQQGVTLRTAEVGRDLEVVQGLTDAAFALAPDGPLLLQEEIRVDLVYARHFMTLNDSSRALSASLRGERAIDQLLRLQGTTSAARLYGAVNLRVLADIHRSRGDHGEAQAAMRRSIATLRSLDDPKSARELAVSLGALAHMLIETGNADDEARRNNGEALSILDGLLTYEPNDLQLRNDQTSALIQAGDLAFASGDSQMARDQYQRANRLAESMDRPDNCAGASSCDMRARRTLYVTHDRLGLLSLRDGVLDEAERHFVRSAELAEQLGAIDAGNTIISRDYEIAQLQAARLAAVRGDMPTARRRIQIALDVARRLADDDPRNLDRAIDVARLVIAQAIARGDADFEEYDWAAMDGQSLASVAWRLHLLFDPEVEHGLARQIAQMRSGSAGAVPACPNPIYC